MPVGIDIFTRAIVASGLISNDELTAYSTAIPTDRRPQSGDQLANLLITDKKLTPFQAEVLIGGANIPLVIGDYVVREKIGAGGMGQVFKAFHRRMKRVAAIKLMAGSLCADRNAILRFQREVEAAARLDHPNIVATYDAGEVGGHLYLAMQYIEGSDLASLVRKSPPLSIERAVDYVCQAAQGLAYAHGEGIVHRDIKPGNLLVDRRGMVKVLDLGLARLEGTASSAALTKSREVLGTIDYMSPEQASETKDVDQRTDIYSLGCTLWYLLTGRRLYDGDTAVRRIMQHREAPLPSLVRARDDATWPLEQVFHKLIAKRPEDRYASMGDVVTALGPYLGSANSASLTGVNSAPDSKLASFLTSMGGSVREPEPAITSPSTKRLPSLIAPPEARDEKTASIEDVPTDSALHAAQQEHQRSIPPQPEKTQRPFDRPAQRAAAVKVQRRSPRMAVALGLGAIALVGAAAFVALRPTPTAGTPSDGKTPVTSGTALAVNATPIGTPSAVRPKPADAPFDGFEARRLQQEWAAYLGIEPVAPNSLNMSMTVIPPGSFLMGSTSTDVEAAYAKMVAAPERLDRETDLAQQPKHRVTLTRPFLLATTETTIEQFTKFCDAMSYKTLAESGGVQAQGWVTGSYLNVADARFNWRNVGYDQTSAHPVGCVSWNDATEFCNWLSASEGLPPAYQKASSGKPVLIGGTGYRLPTEAEWEFACRAGSTTIRFWGDDPSGEQSALYAVMNVDKQTRPVGKLLPNPFGLHDIMGNACEWVEDLYEPDYYQSVVDGVVDPAGPPTASKTDSRVFRGASVAFKGSPDLTSAQRNRRTPISMIHHLGFRVARSIDVK